MIIYHDNLSWILRTASVVQVIRVMRTGQNHHLYFLELTDEVDECQNQIRVQAKKVRSKLKRFKKENDARIEADSEVAGSFLDRCARKSLKLQSCSRGMRPVQNINQLEYFKA